VTVDTNTRIPDARFIRALWIGLLLPPVVVLADIEIAYALVPAACSSRNALALHLVHGIALLLVLAGGLTAWRNWRVVGREWPDSEGGPLARSRFLSGVGVSLSALCVLVILACWSAVLLLDPCQ
jgi:hypothetical protein